MRARANHFILKHGRLFTSIAPERKFLPWLQRPHSCYTNCLQLAVIEKLVYVEGNAIIAGTGVDVAHAWCLDTDGRVVDPTWEVPGDAYFGVPDPPDICGATIRGSSSCGRSRRIAP